MRMKTFSIIAISACVLAAFAAVVTGAVVNADTEGEETRYYAVTFPPSAIYEYCYVGASSGYISPEGILLESVEPGNTYTTVWLFVDPAYKDGIEYVFEMYFNGSLVRTFDDYNNMTSAGWEYSYNINSDVAISIVVKDPQTGEPVYSTQPTDTNCSCQCIACS